MSAPTPPVLLVHGGLGEDMDSERFWRRSGVEPGLRAAGFDVEAPDRDTVPPSWTDAAHALADNLTVPTTVVAGSNGVSVAVRLALDHPLVVDRLVLLWPATCGDRIVDDGAPAEVRHLLAGETLRGITTIELAGLDVLTAVMASEPADRFHALHTVEQLITVMPRAAQIREGFPESLRPEFRTVCDAFLATIIPLLR